jgi:repressor LexA
MTEPLSATQARVYAAIRASVRRERRPPTIDDIRLATGVKSKSNVHYHLHQLAAKGLIVLEEGTARGIRLTREPGVPVLGRIAAGEPIEHFDAGEVDELPLAMHAGGDAEEYALLVRGDSMIEDHIYDGDYVLVCPAKVAHDGEIVVATHLVGGGAATVKRFFAGREPRRIRLQPANATMQPIYVPSREWAREWELQGTVTGLYRVM